MTTAPPDRPLIEAHELCKYYGDFTAVRNISFSVPRGSITAFLGPNGAGKSTTMKMLTGYLAPSAGRASIAGFDVDTHRVEASRALGYLPENGPLYVDMTPSSYLAYAGSARGMAGGALRSALDRVAASCRVEEVWHKPIRKLSKGFRQRVGLAQAILHDPQVLILDEPTAGLDPKQIIETRQLIRALKGNHTIVLSTHILPEVAQTCQKVVIISKGKVVATDTPDALTERLRGAVTVFVQAQGPIDDVQRALQSIPGVMRVGIADTRENTPGFEVDSEKGADIRSAVANAVVRGGWDLLELRPMRMSLEDIFLSLTTEERDPTLEPVERVEPLEPGSEGANA